MGVVGSRLLSAAGAAAWARTGDNKRREPLSGYLDVHETEGVCLGFTGEGAEDEADEARLARLFDGVVGQPVCRTGEETQLRHNQAHQAAPPVCAAVCAAPETV